MNVKEICTYFGLRGRKCYKTWEHFIMQGFMISTPSKENEMSGACEMYGSEENYDPGFGGETRVKETARDA